MKRLIRISSRALGEPVHVRVYVYDDLGHLRRDMTAFSGNADDDDNRTLGATQAWSDSETGLVAKVLVRLHRGHLGTQIITHELHHASTALYGAHVGDGDPQLNHANEPFAHLHSDLCHRLVGRLCALGYYDREDD